MFMSITKQGRPHVFDWLRAVLFRGRPYKALSADTPFYDLLGVAGLYTGQLHAGYALR